MVMTKEGERKMLTNVYYIPDLRSNIISLGQATESGCEVRMKDDCLLLYDRDNKLIVKVKHSPNRLYKVILEVENTKCLQMVHHKESSKWHSHLGHLDLSNLKLMVDGVEKETCADCLCGKQVQKTFPQESSYRATRVQELVQGDLCVPITPSTAGRNRHVFVLIDDYSRYM